MHDFTSGYTGTIKTLPITRSGIIFPWANSNHWKTHEWHTCFGRWLAQYSRDHISSLDPWNERFNPQRISWTSQQIFQEPRLVNWLIVYTKQAQKDSKKISSSNLVPQAKRLLDILAENPFQNPPPYERLVGDLEGAYSRRINIQHRLVYQVYQSERTVKVIRMWSHYE